MKFHLNTAKKNDSAISDVIDQFFKSNKKIAKGYVINRIKNWWKISMGPIIDGYTKSIYIHKRILYIHVTSAALRHELSHAHKDILAKLQESLGVPYIEKVVIK